MTRLLALLTLVLVAGCDRGASEAELAKRNRESLATADPAVTAALEDPIMTDRDLEVADNSRRVRLVRGPAEALYPPRTRSNAAIWSAIDRLNPRAHCEAGFKAGVVWATRLPTAFAPFPGARLIEAAGHDAPACRSRMVAVRAAAAPEAVLEWYRARAVAAGYTAEVQHRGADQVLGGTRARDGASFYLVVSPHAAGSEAALIAIGG